MALRLPLPPDSLPEPLSQTSDTTEPSRQRNEYRPARSLPYELRQHCITFIEEKLCTVAIVPPPPLVCLTLKDSQAFSLLLSLLTAGVDSSRHARARILPAYVPHSQIVALAATLVVHPSMTNRALSPEQVRAADEALSYLDHLLALVGPSNSKFTIAFSFSHLASPRAGRQRGPVNQDDELEMDDGHGNLHVGLANHSSIWNQAKDFWHVVGWAFNCSTRYPSRWDRWKLWLDFILRVMEDDLKQWQATSGTDQSKDSASGLAIESTLLAHYLASAGENQSEKRRVMKAIFANGSKKSLAEFGEVWKNETQERKKREETFVSKRRRLDFDAGDFGDYMDIDEEEDEHEERTAQPTTSMRRSVRKRLNSPPAVSDYNAGHNDDGARQDLGGTSSISLRQRFVALVGTSPCVF